MLLCLNHASSEVVPASLAWITRSDHLIGDDLLVELGDPFVPAEG